MASHEGQYNPRLVTCTISGAVGALNIPLLIPNLPTGIAFPATVVGRAADNFFNVTNAADMVSMAVGAEGNATHVINNDETGNISIVLTRGSFFNRVMSLLFRAQRLIGEGQLPPFTFGVKIRDNNAVPATQHTGLSMMILRQPDDAFGASDGEITWGFVGAQIVSNFSGRIA